MANEKWRMDLRKDIREAMDATTGGTAPQGLIDAVLLSTLPHLEAAYKRGEVAGHSRAGYKVPSPREEN